MLHKFTHCLKATILLLIVLVGSCKKNASEIALKNKEQELPIYFLKFKVDGIQKNYTQELIVQPFNYKEPSNGKYYTGVNGMVNRVDVKKNTILVALITDLPNVLGATYVNFSPSPLGTERASSLTISYFDENGDFYVSFGDEISKLYGITSDGQTKLSEISSTYVKGVFNGTVYNSNHTKSKKITEGEFYMKFRNIM